MFLKRLLQAAAILLLTVVVAVALFTTIAHAAQVVAQISLSTQRMQVFVDGRPAYTWKVSTARSGYRTPTGDFRPYMLSPNHRSSRYGGAPMPYSIFFSGNYAIHGSTEVQHLGQPASHGCVRLHPRNAAKLYSLVENNRANTTIMIRK